MRPLWAAACLALACATVPPQVGTAPPETHGDQSEQKYQAIFARYSDHSEVYHGMDTEMFAAATFETMPFREARVRRQALFQVWPEQKLAAELAQQQTEASQANVFFFGVHLNDYHFNDFDRSRTIWRIVLVTPNGEIAPTKVQRIGRANLDMRTYYPYMGEFWDAYELDFPKTDANGQPVIPPGLDTVTLRVASTLGKSEFKVAAH
jgi:hypothetical protein